MGGSLIVGVLVITAVVVSIVAVTAIGGGSACAVPNPPGQIRYIESAGTVNGFVTVSDDGRYVLLADGESGWDRVDTRTGVRVSGETGGWLDDVSEFADTVTGANTFERADLASGTTAEFEVPAEVLGTGYRLRSVRAAGGGRTVLSIGQEGGNATLYLYDDATQTLITDTPTGLGIDGWATSLVSFAPDGSSITTVERSVFAAQPTRWVRRDLDAGTIVTEEMPDEHDAVLGYWFASPNMEWVWFRSAAGEIVDGVEAGPPRLYRRNTASGETVSVPVDLDEIGDLHPDNSGGAVMLAPAVDGLPSWDAQLYYSDGVSPAIRLTDGIGGSEPNGAIGPGRTVGLTPLVTVSAGSVVTFTSFATNLVAETAGADPGARLFQIDLGSHSASTGTTPTMPPTPIATSAPVTVAAGAASTTTAASATTQPTATTTTRASTTPTTPETTSSTSPSTTTTSKAPETTQPADDCEPTG